MVKILKYLLILVIILNIGINAIWLPISISNGRINIFLIICIILSTIFLLMMLYAYPMTYSWSHKNPQIDNTMNLLEISFASIFLFICFCASTVLIFLAYEFADCFADIIFYVLIMVPIFFISGVATNIMIVYCSYFAIRNDSKRDMDSIFIIGIAILFIGIISFLSKYHPLLSSLNLDLFFFMCYIQSTALQLISMYAGCWSLYSYPQQSIIDII